MLKLISILILANLYTSFENATLDCQQESSSGNDGHEYGGYCLTFCSQRTIENDEGVEEQKYYCNVDGGTERRRTCLAFTDNSAEYLSSEIDVVCF